ncbi:ornithine cyclodeaminase [Roseibium sp. TrichSKD4]|uniref:ornithine cyclodeaminase family protein n=1 Tax=Roseibium sp. TrichSKD4 TaxID=744980 RepID=UPI0001E56297|nr:ornithine cyclodeaminase family protein [Roseibium sp. TrichSKD4]EFO33811.1 ornithine cyclodeaminase [Roseibium sp. TrichSKD4]
MRYIPEEVSAKLTSHEIAYKAVKSALIAASESATIFPVVLAHGSEPTNSYAIKSSAVAELAGLKVGSYWPGNDALGVPRHNSIILLFDQSCGRIGAAVEAGKLNAYRTAAANAVAADVLARAGAQTLAVFGAGHQAEYEVRALARIRDLKRVLVVTRNPDKGAQFVSALNEEGILAELMEAEEACHAADMIVTVTPANAPLFDAAWVQPGTHVASMGSDSTGKQELPPELFQRAHLFCDLPAQSRQIGEFQNALDSTELTAIGEVLSGKTNGRTTPEDITVFDSSGLSVQDLYVAQTILDLVDAK